MARPYLSPGSQNVPPDQLTGNEIVQIVRGGSRETQTTTAAIAALGGSASTLVVQDSDDDVVSAVTQITFVGATVSGGPTTNATVTITGGGGGLPTGLAPVVGDEALQVLTTDPSDDAVLNIKPTDGNAGVGYLEIDSYNGGGESFGTGGQIVLSGARGVAGTPTASQEFDHLSEIITYGFDGDDYYPVAFQYVEAYENFDGDDHAVAWVLETLGTDSEPSAAVRLSITGAGVFQVGIPSGPAGSPGDVNISGEFKINGTPIGGGGDDTITLTADTNIAAGTAVSVNAAGHAVQTFGLSPAIANTALLIAAPTALAQSEPLTTLQLNSSNFVTFSPGGAPTTGMISASISGTVITPGTFKTSAYEEMQGAAALSSSSFVFTYTTSGGAMEVAAATISGGVITIGTPEQPSGATTAPLNAPQMSNIVALSSTSFLLTFYDGSQCWYQVGTVSGTTITLGTPGDTNVPSGNINLTPLALSATEVVLAWSTGGSLFAMSGTISSTTLTAGSPVSVSANVSAQFSIAAAGTSHFVVAWGDNTDAYQAFAVAGSSSTTTTTLGTVALVSPSVGQGGAPVVTALSSTEIAFLGGGFVGPSIGSLSGVTLTITAGVSLPLPILGGLTATQYQFQTGQLWPPLAAVSSTEFAWMDPQYNIYEGTTSGVNSPPIEHTGLWSYALFPISASQVLAVIQDFQGNISARVVGVNAINSRPIGCSASAVTSGNPATITLSGACSGFSGLSPGVEYYANGDGTLTTANTGYSIGVALTSSQLLVL